MIEAEKQTYEHILFEADGAIAHVTMNRPEKRNALSLAHMQELIRCLKAIGEGKEAQVVVLGGDGPAFCAGHDLSEMVGRDPEFYRHLFDVCCELMETIQTIPQPVIAKVHGVATAAGCQLAATCDLVVASENARFATPGVKIGLFCSTPMVALSRAIGRKKAMEMLLTGDFIYAEQAIAEGLVTRVVRAGEPWIIERFERLSVVRKLERNFPKLEETGCKVGIGVATGADRVFIGPKEQLDVEESRRIPLVTTKDTENGSIEWKGLFVLNPYSENSPGLVNLEAYPKFRSYLGRHREQIEKRHVAKKNPGAWYKTIDRIHPDLTAKPKLLIPDIKGEMKVVLDKGEYYPHHNLYYILTDSWDIRALQRVLESRVAEAFIQTYSVRMRGDFLRCQAQYLRKIRLPMWSEVSERSREALLSGDSRESDRAIRKLYRLDKSEWDALDS
jgi:enoyl-CoA hydratase/carnithine racemase